MAEPVPGTRHLADHMGECREKKHFCDKRYKCDTGNESHLSHRTLAAERVQYPPVVTLRVFEDFVPTSWRGSCWFMSSARMGSVIKTAMNTAPKMIRKSVIWVTWATSLPPGSQLNRGACIDVADRNWA